MNQLTNDLQVLGDSLQQAWRTDHSRRARRQPRRRLAVVAATIILLIAVGAAIASTVLKSSAQEEQGLLGGHLLFKGTHPTCTQQSATSFVCTLESAPTEMTFWAGNKQLRNAYLGVKTATVDSRFRVDGGCVSTATDGRRWQCYLGQEAVKHQIIDAGFLGQYLPEPPTG